jgi:hypothetical protein
MRCIAAIAALATLTACVDGGYSSRIDMNGLLWSLLGSLPSGNPNLPQGERR